jgi:ABC-type oligopeptide transport system substrate-binding subunit
LTENDTRRLLPIRLLHWPLVLMATFSAASANANAQPIIAAGQPAQLDVRAAGERSLRITLKPSASRRSGRSIRPS